MQPVPVAPRPSWVVTSGKQAPEVVDRLLRSLPGWFGVESSNAGYVAAARTLPTYLAWPADAEAAEAEPAEAEPAEAEPAEAEPAELTPGTGRKPAGVLLAERHFPAAAEIHLLAVQPDLHRRGAGRALVEALERNLTAEGVRLLQVKTLGPSYPDVGYELTRQFYLAMGFEPLEEITGLWPGNPCLIMVRPLTS